MKRKSYYLIILLILVLVGIILFKSYSKETINSTNSNSKQHKLDKIVNLCLRDRKYPPIEIFMVTQIDPNNYRCKLKNGEADDSLHLLEFLEDFHPISYSESSVFWVNLHDSFEFAVEPHIYTGHNWEVLKVKNWNNKKFTLPPKLSNAVLFSIIEERNIAKRKYKVFWVVNYVG